VTAPTEDGSRSPPPGSQQRGPARVPTGVVPTRTAVGAIRRRPTGERPPLPRDFSGAARFWLVVLVLLAVTPFLGLAAAGGSGGYVSRVNVSILEAFRDLRGPRLTSVMRAVDLLGSDWTIGILRWGALLTLAMYRRWQHVLAFLAAVLIVGWVLSITALPPTLPPSPREVPIPALVAGQLAPSAAMAGLGATVVGMAYSLATPGRARGRLMAVGVALLAGLAMARMYFGFESPSAVLTGAIVGVAIPLVAFRIIAPEKSFPVSYRRGRAAHLDVGGPRGAAIRRALRDQLGIEAVEVEPFGLAGSGGSTPLRIRVSGPGKVVLFGKLYALSHLRSDRWYKLGRMIRYGALEDEKPFSSVRRLVEYEDYMLRLMSDAGIPSAGPYGFAELTPEREYLLVTEFLDGGEEILRAGIDRDVAWRALTLVRSLWDAGIAHRDIKPSNLLVRDGKVYLIDVAFCQNRPSPWRQAVDLANMMLVLAIGTTPRLVYEEATRLFTPEEIAEAFAATRGITIPSQLRAEIRKDGRDLIGEFRALAPVRRPISIQRWSLRRIGLTVGVVLALILASGLVSSTLSGAGLR
jgi:tRNA A-37 threonylcarbamoyl transferase component Bud32